MCKKFATYAALIRAVKMGHTLADEIEFDRSHRRCSGETSDLTVTLSSSVCWGAQFLSMPIESKAPAFGEGFAGNLDITLW